MDKKTFYKVSVQDAWWVVTKEQLSVDIANWVEEYERVTVRPIKMTQEKFDNLPEFEG